LLLSIKENERKIQIFQYKAQLGQHIRRAADDYDPAPFVEGTDNADMPAGFNYAVKPGYVARGGGADYATFTCHVFHA
jgi:hypothetical protein